MHAIRTYIFYQSLNRLQRGLSAIAELLVMYNALFSSAGTMNLWYVCIILLLQLYCCDVIVRMTSLLYFLMFIPQLSITILFVLAVTFAMLNVWQRMIWSLVCNSCTIAVFVKKNIQWVNFKTTALFTALCKKSIGVLCGLSDSWSIWFSLFKRQL